MLNDNVKCRAATRPDTVILICFVNQEIKSSSVAAMGPLHKGHFAVLPAWAAVATWRLKHPEHRHKCLQGLTTQLAMSSTQMTHTPRCCCCENDVSCTEEARGVGDADAAAAERADDGRGGKERRDRRGGRDRRCTAVWASSVGAPPPPPPSPSAHACLGGRRPCPPGASTAVPARAAPLAP